jgi:hypothetical protein
MLSYEVSLDKVSNYIGLLDISCINLTIKDWSLIGFNLKAPLIKLSNPKNLSTLTISNFNITDSNFTSEVF